MGRLPGFRSFGRRGEKTGCGAGLERRVRGGKAYGVWPGLEQEQLYEARDLNITTDFRDVLGELIRAQSGTRDLSIVFPGYTPKSRNILAA